MKPLRLTLQFAAVLSVVACSGNDANKCKVTALESGEVRVNCPGQPAITLPAGSDGSAGTIECEMVTDDLSGREVLVCDGLEVELRSCPGGAVGEAFLGTQDELAATGFVEAEKSVQTVRFLEENACERLEGTVYITASSASLYPEILERLRIVERLVVVGEIERTEMPNLVAASVTFLDAPNSIDKLIMPVFEDGALTITGGVLDGNLELSSFKTGLITISNVQGLRELRIPKFESGQLELSGLDDLEVLDVRSARVVEAFRFEFLPALTTIDARSLEYATRVRLADLPSLSTVDFSGLVEVAQRIELHRFGTVELLEFPRLERVGGLTIERAQNLRLLSAPELRVIFTESWVETNATTSSPAIDILLPKLETVGRAAFSNENLRKLDLTSLRAVTQGVAGLPAPVLAVISDRLEELVVPNLSNTILNILLSGTPTVPVQLDISSFYFDVVDSRRTLDGHALLIRSDSNHEVALEFGNVNSSWFIDIEGVRFAEPFQPGPTLRGAFRLTNIETGSMVDLSAIENLRRVILTDVGSAADPAFLHLTGAGLEEIMIEDGHYVGADLRVESGASVELHFQSGGRFHGDIALNGPGELTNSPSLRLFSSPNHGTGEIRIDSVRTGELQRFSLSNYGTSLGALDLPNVRALSLVGDYLTLSSLRIPRIDAETTALWLTLPAMPVDGIHLNPVVQPAIAGTIQLNWQGQACPLGLFELLPSINFVTGCVSE